MKQHLFTLHAWYCWLIHSLVVMGSLATALFVYMQWEGPENVGMTINLPTIEHTFKQARK